MSPPFSSPAAVALALVAQPLDRAGGQMRPATVSSAMVKGQAAQEEPVDGEMEGQLILLEGNILCKEGQLILLMGDSSD